VRAVEGFQLGKIKDIVAVKVVHFEEGEGGVIAAEVVVFLHVLSFKVFQGVLSFLLCLSFSHSHYHHPYYHEPSQK